MRRRQRSASPRAADDGLGSGVASLLDRSELDPSCEAVRCAAWLDTSYVAEQESVTLNDFPDPDGESFPEDRSGIDEGVELAVLAAGINAGREIVEQLLVEPAPGERAVELCRIDTRKSARAESLPPLHDRARSLGVASFMNSRPPDYPDEPSPDRGDAAVAARHETRPRCERDARCG